MLQRLGLYCPFVVAFRSALSILPCVQPIFWDLLLVLVISGAKDITVSKMTRGGANSQLYVCKGRGLQ